MITQIFTAKDTEFYATWHYEEGGIVSLVVPNVGEIRMTAAKAEEIAANLTSHAEYVRFARGVR
jgi:hypothetical protein